jgi:hypothetical protein
MAFRQKVVEREPAGNRVLRVADETPVTLGDAACFFHQGGMRIDFIELVATGGEEIDFMRRHQCAQRKRVLFDEGDRFAIERRRRMQGKIDALDRGIGQAEILCPGRKHPHDRAAAGRDADEIQRWSRGRRSEHQPCSAITALTAADRGR